MPLPFCSLLGQAPNPPPLQTGIRGDGQNMIVGRPVLFPANTLVETYSFFKVMKED